VVALHVVAPIRAWLLLVPLGPIVVGATVARMYGTPLTASAPTLLGAVLGALAVTWAIRASTRSWRRAEVVLPLLAFGGIVATLFSEGMGGVHRWLVLGPVRLNVSAALAPWFFIGLLSHVPRVRAMSLAAALAVALVHVAQPDAAQASAFALGALPCLVARFDRRVVAASAVFLFLAALLAWSRPDPLLPLDHVERILWFIAARGPAAWTLACGAGLLSLAPFAFAWRRDARGLALMFLAYELVGVSASFIGHYPVALFGAGAGPVLGWYMALGAVLRHADERRGSMSVVPSSSHR
jgi:cell division protein FtsW (lipid II flippase)